MYSVPDLALKHLMINDMKMGGKLVIANGDHFQLQPINGSSMWLSTHMLLQYDILLLKYYVRSRSDIILQKILSIMRKLNKTENDIDYIATMICQNCNFSNNWNEVPNHVLRVAPKKKSVSKVSNDSLKKVMEDSSIRTVVSKSQDQYQQGDSWVPLNNKKYINQLSRKVKEPEMIIFYPGFGYNFEMKHTWTRQSHPHNSKII